LKIYFINILLIGLGVKKAPIASFGSCGGVEKKLRIGLKIGPRIIFLHMILSFLQMNFDVDYLQN